MQRTKVDVSRSMTVLTRHMHDGKVWFIQGETVEEAELMDRVSRLTDAELTTQVRIGPYADGSPGDDKLRLAFEDDDDDDDSSRTANRRVLFEEIGRTKCDPSSSSWDRTRATEGQSWNTTRSSHDWASGR